nr:MAG TPA: hypothetical protein [Caudoviricetes sp.]
MFDRKTVKRCESAPITAVQRVSSVQLVAPTHLLFSARKFCMHIFAILYPKTTIIWCYQLATSNLKVINSLNDIQIGVVNWLYKWRNR